MRGLEYLCGAWDGRPAPSMGQTRTRASRPADRWRNRCDAAAARWALIKARSITTWPRHQHRHRPEGSRQHGLRGVSDGLSPWRFQLGLREHVEYCVPVRYISSQPHMRPNRSRSGARFGRPGRVGWKSFLGLALHFLPVSQPSQPQCTPDPATPRHAAMPTCRIQIEGSKSTADNRQRATRQVGRLWGPGGAGGPKATWEGGGGGVTAHRASGRAGMGSPGPR